MKKLGLCIGNMMIHITIQALLFSMLGYCEVGDIFLFLTHTYTHTHMLTQSHLIQHTLPHSNTHTHARTESHCQKWRAAVRARVAACDFSTRVWGGLHVAEWESRGRVRGVQKKELKWNDKTCFSLEKEWLRLQSNPTARRVVCALGCRGLCTWLHSCVGVCFRVYGCTCACAFALCVYVSIQESGCVYKVRSGTLALWLLLRRGLN